MSMERSMVLSDRGRWFRLLWGRTELAVLAGGFVLGQAVLFGRLRPFALGWLAAVLLRERRLSWPAVAGVLLGQAMMGFGGEMVSNMFLAAAFMAVFWPEKWRSGDSWLAAPLTACGLNVFCKSIFCLLPLPMTYTLADAVSESLLLGLFMLACQCCGHGAQALWHWGNLLPEEKISWMLMFLALLLGMNGWHLAGMDVQSICARALCMAAAYQLGAGGGAVFGVMAGMLVVLSGAMTTASMGFYGLAGVLGGLMRPIGKWGVGIGFLTGNVLLMLYLANGEQLLMTVVETAIAGVIFALLPLADKTMEERQPDCKLVQGETGEREKMERIGRIFTGLSEELRLGQKADEEEQVLDALEGMYKRVYIQVCSDCIKWQECWEKKGEWLYREFSKACDLLEQQGTSQGRCFSPIFAAQCPRTALLEVALLNQMDLVKQKDYYRAQIVLAKETVARQLAGIGQVVEDLAKEDDYGKRAEKKIMALASKERFLLKKVRVYANAQRDWEVALELEDFFAEEMACALVEAKVSKWMKRPYKIADWAERDRERGICQALLVPASVPQIVVGAAMHSKAGHTLSGDCWRSIPLAAGKAAIVLSDGMGSGEEAMRQSATTVNLLERLLVGGATQQLALEIVNAVLLLRSDEESFATVDLAVVDAIRSQAEFVKISAAPSFLKRKDQVRIFRSYSLPVGILNEVDMEKQICPLEAGDLLIMMSDGIYAIYEDAAERWQQMIAQLPTDEPQLAADYLMALAVSCYGEQIGDDLTVLAVRVTEETCAPSKEGD